MSLTIAIVLQILLVLLLSPLLTGFIRKIKARLQGRQGASMMQPYRDLQKLFHKDEVVSHDASWIFLAAPYIVFAVTILVAAGLPLLTDVIAGNPMSNFLVVVYLLALGTFFLALSGIDVGSSFGGFGSSREMTFAALAEGGLIFSILALAIIARSTDLSAITNAIATLPFISFFPVILAFLGFIIALLCETCRFPFDNPSTHLELTMIHEAMILEYSGKRLALMEWASANKLMIFIVLGVNLFFPWTLAGAFSFASLGLAFVFLILKIAVIAVFIGILESSIAKFRFFRLPDLLFTSFVLSVIALGLII
jgi:formate hydrogenlyase subunit 4